MTGEGSFNIQFAVVFWNKPRDVQRITFVSPVCGLLSAKRGEVNTKTVHSLAVEQLRKWPQVSPRNRPTHSRDASMGFVVMMERGRQWPDLERTVAMETTGRAKSSCRLSADALWVKPFKHDLLTSLFIYSLLG